MKIFLLLSLFVISSYALDWESGKKKVNIIELFTSESCSSCPPAERWMNNLKNSDELFKSFVPIEFHVDYWNYLNWKDKFSRPEYTQRQRKYASWRNQNSVFTPQLLINSSLDWHYSKPIPPKNNEESTNIKVTFDKESYKASIQIESTNSKEYTCEAALLGGNYTTKVKGGENQGRTLHHEFVALQLKSTESKNKKCEIKLEKKQSIPKPAIAIWIKEKGDLRIIQATGHYIN